jgi:hypothetical protein
MGRYGDLALRATLLVQRSACASPVEAWEVAARELLPDKPESQHKGCPKGAYLGLCEAGLVVGVPRGYYTESRENKGYAIDAVRLLIQDATLADRGAQDGGARKLWLRVMNGKKKQANSQMDVVLALWNHGLIARSPRR